MQITLSKLSALLGLLVGLAGQANAQFCYQFSGGPLRFTVNVNNNLPSPTQTISLVPPGGTTAINTTSYRLSSGSGNSATFVSGQGQGGQATSPPLPLFLVSATSSFWNTLGFSILAAAENDIVAGISLQGPIQFLLPSGLAPLPPLSSFFLKFIFLEAPPTT